MELPEPPDDYSPAQRRAWRQGAVAMARVVGTHAGVLAAHLEADVDPERDVGAAPAETDRCETCGAELVESLGGAICPDCDT